jgi:DNA-binding NarL/FixJ family response regulator
MATILIVDDEQDVCDLLTTVLSPDGHTVHTAVSGLEVLDMVRCQHFDLALLDVWMRGLNGIELLERLKGLAPNMPVVIITGRPACETAVLALRLGAFDYLQKPFALEDLRTTVRRALAGKRLPTQEDRKWAAEQREHARPWLAEVEQLWNSMTERERQVLTGLVAGQTDAEIAEALGISSKTVGNHVSHLLAKLRVHSRTKAAVWAVRAGVWVVDREKSL